MHSERSDSALTPEHAMAQAAKEAACFLRMLGNEQRLHVLCLLLEHGEMSVNQILARISLSQSALSQHLARMRDEALVATRRESQMIHYRIADPKIQHIIELLKSMYCQSPATIE